MRNEQVALDARRPVLRHTLQALWAFAPLIEAWPDDAPGAPSLRTATLWLPAQAPHPRWYEAAAAHAAAHAMHSRGGFDPRGVHPLTRALVGLLEDARVERLAAQELPGLWSLWHAHHTASARCGNGLEALMARLARALHDPGYDDPHAWVRKGRTLFLDHVAKSEGDAATLRQTASRLGHDIGQMRLRLHDPAYRPAPSYRDDHACLWEAEAVWAEPTPSREERAAMEMPASATPAPSTPAPRDEYRYPEWDHRIGAYRRDWCCLHEQVATAGDARTLRRWVGETQAWLATLARRAQRSLDSPRPSRRRLCRHGDEPDLDAALREAVQRRAGHAPAAQVHRDREARAVRAAWLLVLDLSASMADEGRLELARRAAWCLSAVAAASGRRFAVHGFHSEGREHQHGVVLKAFDEPRLDDARLAGLRAQGSTRLGVSLRHAQALLKAQPAERRTVLLLSDGEPHDIDVHDPTHLLADARRAVREARRSGVAVHGLAVGASTAPAVRRVLGSRHVHTLRRAEDLGPWLTRMRGL
ncbi:VWA domain-containing protein [Sphaerotilaceae bacterium SBD11-9]